MLKAVFWLVLLTLLPTLELRASIPVGFGTYGDTLGPVVVVALCVVTNILLAPIVWVFLDKVIHLFLRVDWINNLYERFVGRARDGLAPYVDRWGTIGLALFIGVPLPGSGVYSGALGAYVLGFGFSRFMLAATLGVLIAGTAVTVVVVTGSTALSIFLKH